MEAFLFLALAYIASFVFGYLMERIRVPWVFAGLLIGLLLSGHSLPILSVLGYIGMLLMLFNIGIELDVREIARSSGFILSSTALIILFEAFLGTMIIHALFHYDWLVSALVALSFATVGEAVLLPILEEFGLVTSRLGKFIIGVGVLDDLFELLVIVLVSLLLGSSAGHGTLTLSLHMAGLLLLFLLVALVKGLRKLHMKLPYPRLGAALPLALFFFFLFVGIGRLVEMDALAAILAGISLRLFLPHHILQEVSEEIRAITYGFFAPLFFLWVGITVELGVLWTHLLPALLLTVAAGLSKVLATWLATRHYFSPREALIAGIGLTVRFSTSIVIIKMLFDANIIGPALYSALVASTALFTLIIPFLFSWLVAVHTRKAH